MFRSLLALVSAVTVMVLVVILGTVVATAFLAGPDGSVTGAYLAANLAVSLAGAFLGGWVVVRLSPRLAFVHAGVLAAILVVLTLPSVGSPAGGQPTWYPWAILSIGVVGVAMGAAGGRIDHLILARR